MSGSRDVVARDREYTRVSQLRMLRAMHKACTTIFIQYGTVHVDLDLVLRARPSTANQHTGMRRKTRVHSDKTCITVLAGVV